MMTVYISNLEIEIDYKPNLIWLIFYSFISSQCSAHWVVLCHQDRGDVQLTGTT